MSYLTGMANSQVYEFPYSGAHASSLPFLNSNYNGYPSQNWPSSLDSLYQKQPSISPNWSNNTMVYQVPGNIPLETILRELGVDVNSLNPSSSNNYYPNVAPPPPVDFIFLPPKRQRRRRVICREITDSESDDDDDGYNRFSRRNRHRNSKSSQNNQSSTRLHSLLGNVWQKGSNAPGDLSQSNSGTNINLQYPPIQNPPIQNPPIQNPSGPMPPPNPGAVGNLWNRVTNATNSKPSPLSDLLSRTRSGGGNVIQPPPYAQQNQEAVQDYDAARYAVANVSQPAPAIASVWNRAQNALPYGPPPTSNPPWNQMSGGPQQQQPPAMNSAWGRMAGASPPPMNPGWNPMSGGPPPPPPPSPPQQQSPAINSVWSRMAAAPPPQQSPPPMNSGWNPMSGGPPPPQQPFYPPGPPSNPPWNPMSGGPPPQQQPFYPPAPPPPQYPSNPYPQQQGPPPSAAARSFATMFSRP